MARKLDAPPSGLSGALGTWLNKLWVHLESQPNFSIASLSATSTPNSYVTGFPGDFCVNLGSGSTASRVWVLSGAAASARTDQGWALVRVVVL